MAMSDLTEKLDAIQRTGEPVFILRARDIFAPDTVRFWAGQLEMTVGTDHPKAIEANKLADQMDAWQRTQSRKIPD